MAHRYIGDLVVDIEFYGGGLSSEKQEYRGTIRKVGVRGPAGYLTSFDHLYAAAVGFGPGVGYDSPQAYDEMALSAVRFSSDAAVLADQNPTWDEDEVDDISSEIDSLSQSAFGSDDNGDFYAMQRTPNGPIVKVLT